MRDFLNLLKDATPILSSILGILGVFNVFKTTSNKLTIWGWLAIGIIISTTIFSSVISKYEDRQNEKEKQKMQDNFNSILMNISKVKHPIKNMELIAWIILPDNNNEVAQLKKQVLKEIQEFKEPTYNDFSKHKIFNISSSVIGFAGEVLIYDITKEGNLWPNDKYPLLKDTLLNHGISTCIKAAPQDPKIIRLIHGDFKTYDRCSWPSLPTPIHNSLTYDIRINKLVMISHIIYSEENTSDNGTITSVNDLPGSQLFFALPTKYLSAILTLMKRHDASEKALKQEIELSDFYKNMEIQSLILQFKPYQNLAISSPFLHKEIINNQKIYSIILPRTSEEFSKLYNED